MAMGGVRKEVCRLSATRMPKNSGSMPKWGRRGRKIGTNRHEDDDDLGPFQRPAQEEDDELGHQEEEHRREVEADDELADQVLAAEIGEDRGEGPGADEQPADHG